MSDTGRQSLTDKATSAIKPDSQKTTTEKAGDTLQGKGDSLASTLEPNSQKSAGQSVGDAFSSNSNQNDQSLIDKAKNAVGLGN